MIKNNEAARVIGEDIKRQALVVCETPDGEIETDTAKKARRKFSDFMISNKNETDFLDATQRARYEDLLNDCEQKEEIAKQISSAYREQINILNKLIREHVVMQRPKSHDNFSIQGFQVFIQEAVAPMVESAKQINEELGKLRKLRARLVQFMESRAEQPKTLNADDLLSIDVNEYFNENSKYNADRTGVYAISNLIDQNDALIKQTEVKFNRMRHFLDSTFRDAVSIYSSLGSLRNAAIIKAFGAILEESDDYDAMVRNEFHKLFENLGGNIAGDLPERTILPYKVANQLKELIRLPF